MTTEMISFKVEGQFITDFARTRVIEGCWRHALSILDSICGTDYELRMQILRCEKRFVGVNTFELVDEDPERDEVKKYLELLRYQYGELLYFPGPGTYWRPYAYTSGYGPEDFHNQELNGNRPAGWPIPYTRFSQGQANPLSGGRALYYIDNPGIDAMHLLVVPDAPTYETYVFWRRIVDPPLWAVELGASDDPQTVLDMHLKAGRHLEERGWAQSFGDTKKPEARGLGKWSAGKTPQEPEPEPIPEQKYDGPPPSTYDVKEIAKFESGWLDRKGNFYSCGYSEHRMVAEHICEMVLKVDLDNLEDEEDPDNKLFFMDGERYLDIKGWAKRTIAANGVWLWDCDRLTKAQKNVIMSWYSIRGEKVPELLKYRMED